MPIAFSAAARSLTILAASPTSDAPSGPQSPPGEVWQSAALKTQAVIWLGTSTAPSRTSNEIGQAGTLASNRSSPSGRPTFVASIGVSPTMSTTQRCDESETPSPASWSLSTVIALSSPEICRSPNLPLSMSVRPARLATPAPASASTPFPASLASRCRGARVLVLRLRGRDLRALGLCGSGARERQLRVGPACREGCGEEPANQAAEASSHGRSVEALTRKGKARPGSEQGRSKLEKSTASAPCATKTPHLYTPRLAGWARSLRNRRKSG